MPYLKACICLLGGRDIERKTALHAKVHAVADWIFNLSQITVCFAELMPVTKHNL